MWLKARDVIGVGMKPVGWFGGGTASRADQVRQEAVSFSCKGKSLREDGWTYSSALIGSRGPRS